MLSGAAGARDGAAAGVAASTIIGFGDCAKRRPVNVKATRIDKIVVRILLAPPSARIDPRLSERLGDRGELRVNLFHVFRDRGLLASHFFGDRQNLLDLLIHIRRISRRSGHKQSY